MNKQKKLLICILVLLLITITGPFIAKHLDNLKIENFQNDHLKYVDADGNHHTGGHSKQEKTVTSSDTNNIKILVDAQNSYDDAFINYLLSDKENTDDVNIYVSGFSNLKANDDLSEKNKNFVDAVVGSKFDSNLQSIKSAIKTLSDAELDVIKQFFTLIRNDDEYVPNNDYTLLILNKSEYIDSNYKLAKAKRNLVITIINNSDITVSNVEEYSKINEAVNVLANKQINHVHKRLMYAFDKGINGKNASDEELATAVTQLANSNLQLIKTILE